MPLYYAGELASSGVVVTVSYRLGFEGSGHLPGVRSPPPAARVAALRRGWPGDPFWGYAARGHGLPAG